MRNRVKALRGERVSDVLRILCVCLFGCAGCVSFDATEARRDQMEAFTNELSRLEAQWLARPLPLEDCVAIAMTNNFAFGGVNTSLVFRRFDA